VSNATPGSFIRFGPMKVNGEARSDQKGSVRTFTPAVCNRTVACPTNEIRHSLPAIRAARRPGRPFGLAAAGVPAEQLCNAIGRRAVRIEKLQAVEVIRHRAVVIARPRGANAKTAESSGGDSGESSEHAAAGDFHICGALARDSPDEP
jgi:hypothetical protein